MKKITSIIVLLIVALFSSCSSSDSSGPSNQNITFKLNGENVTAAVTSAKLYKSQATNEKLLQITAETTENVFELSFFAAYTADDAIPTGNYLTTDTVDDGDVYLSYKINGNTYGVHFPDAGTLTIASASSSAKKASGTFNETLHAIGETEDFDLLGVTIPYEVNITNGVFTNISYEVVNLN